MQLSNEELIYIKDILTHIIDEETTVDVSLNNLYHKINLYLEFAEKQADFLNEMKTFQEKMKSLENLVDNK